MTLTDRPWYDGVFFGSAVQQSKRHFLDIQPEVRLAGLFIRTMAFKTSVRQDRFNVKVEIYSFGQLLVVYS